jgi:hypothetical protein
MYKALGGSYQHLKAKGLESVYVNPRLCVLFSPCPFFPLGFGDGVFSEVHMGWLLRAFLATRVGVVFWPLLNMSNY